VLLKFDLRNLPENAIISSAYLKMYAYHAHTGRTIDVYYVRDDSWDSSKVTWNNQPSHTSKLSSRSSNIRWRSWGVTSKVKSDMGGTLSLKVMDHEEGTYGSDQLYRSGDFGSEVPYLYVSYTVYDCNIGSDASNYFNTANSIFTPKNCKGYLDSTDKNDYYKFSVTKGSTIDVDMTPPSGANFNIYLYDQNNIYKKGSAKGTGLKDSLSYVADSSGYWRIRIYRSSGSGDYSLNVNLKPDTSPPPAPVISSSTHKSDYKWYNNYDPKFTWDTPSDASGIVGYSYYFNHASLTTPDKTADTTGNSKSYSNRADGTWYFHVRAKDNAGNWGDTGHYKVKIDAMSPSISISTPANNAVLTSKDVSIYWSGSDSGSGIGYYKINMDNGNWIDKGTKTSHIFSSVGGGTHTVYVKAVDKMGHSKTTNVGFTVQLSLPDLSISSNDITFIKVGGN
ncbi:MAG: DNRLRE domain-containing protein, partial [Candidatus Omnitrophica bacterium]|nr:DNRLRE domain-containing protein [Candidatus Omnitrophota bacterium]